MIAEAIAKFSPNRINAPEMSRTLLRSMDVFRIVPLTGGAGVAVLVLFVLAIGFIISHQQNLIFHHHRINQGL